MKIKCILIDDEPFALDILEDDLLDFDNIEVCEKFSSPVGVADYLKNEKVELIFSDIQMPEMLGTNFIRDLENPPLVIFTTAYHQYAVEGFELNAVDYLLKPIRKERLGAAIEKVVNLIKLKTAEPAPEEENHIVVTSEYKKVKLLFNEIIYIEGLKDYVKIYLESRVYPLLTRSNLKGMEKKLPDSKFVRIHNSFIVNSSKITGVNLSKLTLGAVEIPVGKKYIDSPQTRSLFS
ncbi:LytR/AlgR family response regulator transcription factor [Arcticibacterium luteifluviistationis]|uniref:DNA-binding response regulator n=1 Tax=Arcticibacterium luteifluviistationis TaxID=1784714 RepID=A0A2Z4GHD8_9BACT|nr:LytTR family DNA-binding domain-containing protein [Arcticibacterium luteifluviistationis]AWW00435.1 DNA-binding response regulator [Arcticibacterium luteifluviistationis]